MRATDEEVRNTQLKKWGRHIAWMGGRSGNAATKWKPRSSHDSAMRMWVEKVRDIIQRHFYAVHEHELPQFDHSRNYP